MRNSFILIGLFVLLFNNESFCQNDTVGLSKDSLLFLVYVPLTNEYSRIIGSYICKEKKNKKEAHLNLRSDSTFYYCKVDAVSRHEEPEPIESGKFVVQKNSVILFTKDGDVSYLINKIGLKGDAVKDWPNQFKFSRKYYINHVPIESSNVVSARILYYIYSDPDFNYYEYRAKVRRKKKVFFPCCR